jgi:hypothetical protein
MTLAAVPISIPEPTLAGPKELLEGPAGSGKTYALATMVDWAQAHGKEVFILFLEQSLETLMGYWRDTDPNDPKRREPRPIPDCLHWHMQPIAPLSFQSLMTGADNVAKLSYESLTKLIDGTRAGANNSFWHVLATCTDFPDDRTGKKFGAIDKWGTDKIFMLDSLSELAAAAEKMTIGNKPMMAQNEYLVAQNNLLNFLRKLITCQCTVVMTAHVRRQTDFLTGTTKTMTKSLGTAIADDIPPLFSDVIYSLREGRDFYWDTAASNIDTKARNLPIASKLPADFAQVMDKWQARGGK